MNPASRYLAAVADLGNADAEMVTVTRAQRARYQRIEAAAQSVVEAWARRRGGVLTALDALQKAIEN